jgi:uncharacterized protein (TIGR02266 family)
MADSRRRATASLKVKYKSPTLGQFIQQFGLDISHGGIFIKTKSPLEPGALIRLELQLSDGTPVIVGSGQVRWRRQAASEGQPPSGMGIEFTRLDPESRRLVDRIVDGREGRPSRFEQTDGAEHAGGSQSAASAPTPMPPPPAPASVVAASRSTVSSGSGLFASSPLRAPASSEPLADTSAQSSFFSQGRRPTSRDVTARVSKPPSPDLADKLVDKLFAEAIPAPAAPHKTARSATDDEITGEFSEREMLEDETALTKRHAAAQSGGADMFTEESAITKQLSPSSPPPNAGADEHPVLRLTPSIAVKTSKPNDRFPDEGPTTELPAPGLAPARLENRDDARQPVQLGSLPPPDITLPTTLQYTSMPPLRDQASRKQRLIGSLAWALLALVIAAALAFMYFQQKAP